MVKDQASSYKDLPVILYQIQSKYRDEARPRAGILRGREFLMKDSYSFDLEDEGLAKSYALHRQAYQRVFERLGLDYRICAATAGAMGGSKSEEFLAPAEAGEDTFADCPNCDFAANTEAIAYELKPVDAAGVPAAEEIPTPDTPTIETLAASLGVEASATLKNLLVKVDGEIVAVGVPGDREVDMGKVEAHFAPAAVEMVTEADFMARPDLVRGYVGPQGLGKVKYVADTRVARAPPGSRAPTRPTRTRRTWSRARDFEVDEYGGRRGGAGGRPVPRVRHGSASGPRHRDRPHLPAGPQVRRRPQARRAGQNGKPGPRHHGFLRHRRLPRGGGARRADRRRQGPVLAGGGRPADVHVVAAGKALQTELAWTFREAVRRGPARPGRRPPRRLPGREVHRLGADRRPADPGRGPPRRRGRRRTQGPPPGEREELTVDEAVARLTRNGVTASPGPCRRRRTGPGLVQSGSQPAPLASTGR
ncbi:proline--tRNA ligase [Streptomyces heliomycini]